MEKYITHFLVGIMAIIIIAFVVFLILFAVRSPLVGIAEASGIAGTYFLGKFITGYLHLLD